MTYVLQLAHDIDFKFTPELIKSLHFMMLEYDLNKSPGNWRPGYISVKNSETGDIVYEGPDASIVRPLVDELVEFLNQPPQDEHNIVTAALAHLNLTLIHPFRDGNGRMARCLQSLVLVRNGTTEPQFCSIEEYLGNVRNVRRYYDVLSTVGGGTWQPERDTMTWIRFCLEAHYVQAMTILRRSKEISRIWTRLETEIKKRNLPERSIYALADATMGYRVRNMRYRKMAEIAFQVASKDLKKLVDAGLLATQGEARGRSYVAADFLVQIRRECKEQKNIESPFK